MRQVYFYYSSVLTMLRRLLRGKFLFWWHRFQGQALDKIDEDIGG